MLSGVSTSAFYTRVVVAVVATAAIGEALTSFTQPHPEPMSVSRTLPPPTAVVTRQQQRGSASSTRGPRRSLVGPPAERLAAYPTYSRCSSLALSVSCRKAQYIGLTSLSLVPLTANSVLPPPRTRRQPCYRAVALLHDSSLSIFLCSLSQPHTAFGAAPTLGEPIARSRLTVPRSVGALRRAAASCPSSAAARPSSPLCLVPWLLVSFVSAVLAPHRQPRVASCLPLCPLCDPSPRSSSPPGCRSGDSAFAYSSVHAVMDAIQANDELQLRFPITESEQRQSARSFRALSNEGIMRGCVGAVDGWLCSIQVPRRSQVGRVASFFSGRYQRYGVNVQACVDSHSRFTAINSASPGGMGDSIAYLRWKLSQLSERFPRGLYLAGDNAYTSSNTLLTPFTRPNTTTSSRDSFNFHLSQLRNRVEMVFGLLVNKWRIFKSPLCVGMKNVGKVVHVACILHNWCINERLRQANEADAESDEDLVTALAELRATNSVEHATPPQAAQDVTVSAQDASAFRRLYDSTQLDVERRVESELLRNAIVAQIGSTLRPQHNICRNAPARA